MRKLVAQDIYLGVDNKKPESEQNNKIWPIFSLHSKQFYQTN